MHTIKFDEPIKIDNGIIPAEETVILTDIRIVGGKVTFYCEHNNVNFATETAEILSYDNCISHYTELFAVRNIVEIGNTNSFEEEQIIPVDTEMRVIDIFSDGDGNVSFILDIDEPYETCIASASELTTIVKMTDGKL